MFSGLPYILSLISFISFFSLWIILLSDFVFVKLLFIFLLLNKLFLLFFFSIELFDKILFADNYKLNSLDKDDVNCLLSNKSYLLSKKFWITCSMERL